jgi:hypothetical protein
MKSIRLILLLWFAFYLPETACAATILQDYLSAEVASHTVSARTVSDRYAIISPPRRY